MYSGVDGREMEADIFMGIVYYQRLRHMVSDKYQVKKETYYCTFISYTFSYFLCVE